MKKEPIHYLMHLFKHILYSVMGVSFLATGDFLLAQSQTGQLRLVISPKEAIVRLDSNRVAAQGPWMNVASGLHRLQAWAPTHDYIDTMVTVETGRPLLVKKLLHHSEAYIQYKVDMGKYKARHLQPSLAWLSLATPIPVLAVYMKRVNDQTQATMAEAVTEADAAQVEYSAP